MIEITVANRLASPQMIAAMDAGDVSEGHMRKRQVASLSIPANPPYAAAELWVDDPDDPLAEFGGFGWFLRIALCCYQARW